jgi:hypothetical protein
MSSDALLLPAAGREQLREKKSRGKGRQRYRNARRPAKWHPPPPRDICDPDHDVTRVMPGIQRPKGPRESGGNGS